MDYKNGDMYGERVATFKNMLLENLEDKSLAELILSRMISVNRLMFSPDFSASEAPEGWSINKHFNTRLANIFILIRYSDTQYISQINLSDTPLSLISMYLATFSPLDNYSLDLELARIKIPTLNYLYSRVFEKLSAEMLLNKGGDHPIGSSRKTREVADDLFYGLIDIAHEKIGLEVFLKFMNEFVRRYVEVEFENDSRPPVEVFLNAVYYCANNSEYPIEWLLSQAFAPTSALSSKIIQSPNLINASTVDRENNDE